MRKNTYTIYVIVIISVIFSVLFTGCSTGNQSYQETAPTSSEETTQEVTVQTTQQASSESATESLTGWRQAYNTVIGDTLEECREKLPDETNHGQYGLYDFDSDSVPELFLEVYGSTMPDYYIYVYDFDGDKAVLLDRIQSAHSLVYGTNRENAVLLGCFGTGGECAWSLLEFKDGRFDSEYLDSYFPDGFADIIEPEENPLPGMGYEIIEIEYYGLDDITGIKN